MEEAKKAEVNTKEKKKFSMKIVVVLLALVVFGLVTTISLRAEYLNISGIGEEYLSVFEQRNEYKIKLFMFNCIWNSFCFNIYFCLYIK